MENNEAKIGNGKLATKRTPCKLRAYTARATIPV